MKTIIVFFFPTAACLVLSRAEAGGAGQARGRKEISSVQHPGPARLSAGHR